MWDHFFTAAYAALCSWPRGRRWSACSLLDLLQASHKVRVQCFVMIVLMKMCLWNWSSGPELDVRILRSCRLEEIRRCATALIERSEALLQAFSFLGLFLDIIALPEANSVPMLFLIFSSSWNIEAIRCEASASGCLDAIVHE